MICPIHKPPISSPLLPTPPYSLPPTPYFLLPYIYIYTIYTALGKPSNKKNCIFNDIDQIGGRGYKKKPNFIKVEKY